MAISPAPNNTLQASPPPGNVVQQPPLPSLQACYLGAVDSYRPSLPVTDLLDVDTRLEASLSITTGHNNTVTPTSAIPTSVIHSPNQASPMLYIPDRLSTPSASAKKPSIHRLGAAKQPGHRPIPYNVNESPKKKKSVALQKSTVAMDTGSKEDDGMEVDPPCASDGIEMSNGGGGGGGGGANKTPLRHAKSMVNMPVRPPSTRKSPPDPNGDTRPPPPLTSHQYDPFFAQINESDVGRSPTQLLMDYQTVEYVNETVMKIPNIKVEAGKAASSSNGADNGGGITGLRTAASVPVFPRQTDDTPGQRLPGDNTSSGVLDPNAIHAQHSSLSSSPPPATQLNDSSSYPPALLPPLKISPFIQNVLHHLCGLHYNAMMAESLSTLHHHTAHARYDAVKFAGEETQIIEKHIDQRYREASAQVLSKGWSLKVAQSMGQMAAERMAKSIEWDEEQKQMKTKWERLQNGDLTDTTNARIHPRSLHNQLLGFTLTTLLVPQTTIDVNAGRYAHRGIVRFVGNSFGPIITNIQQMLEIQTLQDMSALRLLAYEVAWRVHRHEWLTSVTTVAEGKQVKLPETLFEDVGKGLMCKIMEAFNGRRDGVYQDTDGKGKVNENKRGLEEWVLKAVKVWKTTGEAMLGRYTAGQI
ncbi:hypothetical protein L198_01301 [Cryptococcus wingfieldii CBS 7118]|uniref:Uncharacterized protein n=1 Tax=Cryptococcus wingfieldii CBS 7118 TaxID=1295528 RepID=A0A1E3K1K2_9TREE|nr:hypothetical protein L198_01301 [Cryptococcus wingfieldii CBS 7118]ODO06072.1 hypothetical protein L198_01301 [Cryptococcus wingfieldii CBS 7118]